MHGIRKTSKRGLPRLAGLLAMSLALAVAQAGCPRPGKERADLDMEMAQPFTVGGVTFQVEDGMALVRDKDPGVLELWECVPVIRLFADAPVGATTDWTITVSNCMPGAVMTAETSGGSPLPVSLASTPLPTHKVWTVTLVEGDEAIITVGPPDRDMQTVYTFAWLSDIQEAIDFLPDVISRFNADSELRWILGGGDLSVEGRDRRERLLLIQQHLETLNIPFYTVPGNHDIQHGNEIWRDTFGRANIWFTFKGVHFRGLDAAAATIDPVMYEKLEETLLPSANPGVCVYFQHIPPFDPMGDRQVGFTTRKEAAKLVSLLVEHHVDVCLYGHIHTYQAFTNGGIPAYISGGGGAEPEGLEGMGRHYLRIVVDAGMVHEVGLVRTE